MHLGKKPLNFSFLFLAILTTSPTPLLAGKLFGIVTNAQTGKPVESVSVVVKQSKAIIRTATTDSMGKFTIDTVPAGSYSVLFSKDTYEPQTISDVYISGLAEKRLDVEMSPGVFTGSTIWSCARVRLGKRLTWRRRARSSAPTSSCARLAALMDVQRVVQNLPSVASGGDQTNEIVVRGSTPGENLFLMDNIEIPNPNHFAQEGAGGGVISLINPLLVKGLTFCAGAPLRAIRRQGLVGPRRKNARRERRHGARRRGPWDRGGGVPL